jgi:hypothetical protein
LYKQATVDLSGELRMTSLNKFQGSRDLKDNEELTISGKEGKHSL